MIDDNAVAVAWTEFLKQQADGILDERAMRAALECAEKYIVGDAEAALTEIRDMLPLVNDAYARRVFRIAANALKPDRPTE